jgi:hypothetical protein
MAAQVDERGARAVRAAVEIDALVTERGPQFLDVVDGR